MVEKPLTRSRGGSQNPFGVAVFIRDYLAGLGSEYGVASVDPERGAPQADIHAAYKEAAHRVAAEKAVAIHQEGRIRRDKRPLTIGETDRLLGYYLERLPYKHAKMRYHSFRVYFSLLKTLGWVEPSPDGEEPSTIQGYYPPAPPRRYYRLTTTGRQATSEQLRDPVQRVYDYPRPIRSAKKSAPERPVFPE